MRPRLTATLLAAALAGCVHPVEERCATCLVVRGQRPELPPLTEGTRRLFLLVPGVLGYGWEWDDPVAALRATPGVAHAIFWWEPWGSLARASAELAAVIDRALTEAPASLEELVVVGHSVGGMVGAHAVGRIQVPAGRRVKLVTIGAPFAGMMGPPCTLDDPLHTPSMIAVMGTFRRYPAPAPGVEAVAFETSWPSDPVMKPRWGHAPAPPEVGPPGMRRIPLDPRWDHNHVVARVVRALLQGSQDLAKIGP